MLFFWIVCIYLLVQVYAYRYTHRQRLCFKSLVSTSFALYVLADEVFGIGVPYLIRCLVIVAMFLHTFFGYFKDLYTRSQIFDRYLHVYGCFVYALFLYSLFTHIFGASVSPAPFAALMVAFTGMAAGGVFEIIEYFIDKGMPVKTQRALKIPTWTSYATRSARPGSRVIFML